MAKENYLTYKGYPLVRSGKTIYYGNAYDPFVIMIQIATTREASSSIRTRTCARAKRSSKKARKKGFTPPWILLISGFPAQTRNSENRRPAVFSFRDHTIDLFYN